jgi:preprotein translocase subunit SecF
LSRTIITGISTILALGALMFAGGEVLFDFSFALLIGLIVGTYSSIFVASPLVFLWRKTVR